MNLENKYLYSTCAGETFGKIERQYFDENNCPVLDITINNINDIVHFQNDIDADPPENEFKSYLTQVSLPKGTVVRLFKVGYVLNDDNKDFIVVVLNTPLGGCYRCSESFQLRETES